MDLQVFPIPIPPPTSLSTRFLWVFQCTRPEHLSHALILELNTAMMIPLFSVMKMDEEWGYDLTYC